MCIIVDTLWLVSLESIDFEEGSNGYDGSLKSLSTPTAGLPGIEEGCLGLTGLSFGIIERLTKFHGTKIRD